MSDKTTPSLAMQFRRLAQDFDRATYVELADSAEGRSPPYRLSDENRTLVARALHLAAAVEIANA